MSSGIHMVFEVSHFARFQYLELSAAHQSPAVPLDCWEFIYVDKGRLAAGGQELESGKCILLPPGSDNAIQVDSKTAANLHCVVFELSQGDLSELAGRVFPVTAELRAYIKLALKEAKFAYRNDLRDPGYARLELNPERPFGAQQMMKTLLEQLLIGLVRQSRAVPEQSYRELARENLILTNLGKNPYFDSLIQYLEQNIGRRLTIEEICRDNLTNRSKVQKVFKECTTEGVISFFQILKIEYAKIMIRESDMNFTQISEVLGFSSVHHFSKKFKQLVKMSPSEYARFFK